MAPLLTRKRRPGADVNDVAFDGRYGRLCTASDDGRVGVLDIRRGGSGGGGGGSALRSPRGGAAQPAGSVVCCQRLKSICAPAVPTFSLLRKDSIERPAPSSMHAVALPLWARATCVTGRLWWLRCCRGRAAGQLGEL